MPESQVLVVELKPSRRLAFLLGTLHLLALIAACTVLAGWPRILVSLGTILAGGAVLREVFLWSERAITSMELFADGRASWRDRRGREYAGRLADDHYFFPIFVVIALQPDEGTIRRVVLASDAVSAEDYRRLRVWLRWRPGLGAR